VSIDLNHLQGFSELLHQLVTNHPDEYVPIFERAAREVAVQMTATGHAGEVVDEKVTIQVQFKNFPRITQIRLLAADHVGKLVTIRGIVVSASRPRIKATNLTIMCRSQYRKHTHARWGFAPPLVVVLLSVALNLRYCCSFLLLLVSFLKTARRRRRSPAAPASVVPVSRAPATRTSMPVRVPKG